MDFPFKNVKGLAGLLYKNEPAESPGILSEAPKPMGILDAVGLSALMPAAQANPVELARQKYPYLRNANIAHVRGEGPSEGRQLEMWAPGDQGWNWKGKHFQRPQGLPLDAHGIETFGDVRPLDVLADYVSHHSVNEDPKLKGLYQQFSASVPENTMLQRYKYHRENMGEDRSYAEWKKDTGLPEYFRGYTFNQFGPNAKDFYTQEQLQILDQVRALLGVDE